MRQWKCLTYVYSEYQKWRRQWHKTSIWRVDKNFLNWQKSSNYRFNKLHIQTRLNVRKTKSRHIIIKCLKTKDEEKSPKADRGENKYKFFREENNKTDGR